jgi:glycosyltransferase involved in cell wall biosynthesis
LIAPAPGAGASATRVVYVANVRLPTEKAHGHAIVQMCTALASAGAEVELWHSRDNGDRAQSVFDYYAAPRSFGVRKLANLDVVPLERWLPPPVMKYLGAAQALTWSWYAARVARDEGAQLYLTRDLWAAWWLTGRGLPVVVEVHIPPEGPTRHLIRRLSRRPSLISAVTLTDGGRERLVAEGLPSGRVTVLRSGVDVSAYLGLPDRQECRRLCGLPSDRPIVGYVGRFQTMGFEKGIPELIRAAGLLHSGHALEPLLVCVGGPMDPVPRYQALARECGLGPDSFLFCDRVPSARVPTWVRALDVAVVPSPAVAHFTEYASPLKIFECMAAGTPIVATDLPAHREVLVHARTAWLVQPGSPVSLAEGIAALLSDPDLRQRMASRARVTVGALDWRHRAERILALVPVGGKSS